MPWTYQQSTGNLYYDGVFITKGYAGSIRAKNDPGKQNVENEGPLPRGYYTIGPPFTHPHAGPYTLRLKPSPSNNMFGRSGFLIHGDKKSNPGTASNGCIILGRIIRQQIWNSGDRDLKVIQ